jgi:hypothetical protein
VQHPPSSHTSLVPHVPQLTAGPQPLFTEPQVARPHAGGVHAVHTPFTHCCAPVHVDGQVTLPLPQALVVAPHSAPPSVGLHSGGVLPQTPPMHDFPAAQVQPIVCPQPSLTVPHRLVWAFGVQVRGAQASIVEASLVPPSGITHSFATQSCPVGHPPQVMATPQESSPITPQAPLGQLFGLHDCDVGSFGSATHTWPEGHAAPQAKTAPEHGSL